MQETQRAPFSGWPILVGCTVLMFFMLGGVQTFAVFVPPIISETGFSLGQVTLMSTLATLGSFTGNMLFGRVFRRLGARWLLFLSSLVCAGYFFATSYSSSLAGMYIAMACGGFATGIGTVAPVSVVMNNWFIKNRATYMSIVIAGSMFGGAILMPVSGQLVEHFGWRTAFRVLGVAVGVISTLISLLVIVDSPEKKGQKAYGAEDAEAVAAQGAAAAGVTPAEAKASLSFWLMLAGILFIGCSTNIENFLPTYWRSQGMGVAVSSTVMGVYALMTGICSILLGRATDRLGGRTYAIMTGSLFVVGAVGVYLLGAAAIPLVIVMLLPFAAGAKKTSNLTPPLVVAEAFGRKHYGAIIGYFTGVFQLGIAISNPIISSLYQSSGGYRLPFFAMAGLNAAAMVLILAALKFAPNRPASALEEAAQGGDISGAVEVSVGA